MKKIKWSLAVLTFTVILSAGIGKAWAYFTTYVEAAGGYDVHLGDHTTITEEPVVRWLKKVTIRSDEDSEPVYVRVRVYCAKELDDALTYSGSGWSEAGDWYYYDGILKGGESAEVLELLIPEGKVPAEPEEGDSFNVIVIHESAPVKYDAEGNPYCDKDDWKDAPFYRKAETGATETEGGGNG